MAGDSFGISVAVSGDTVVVGARYEDSNATGVNGDGTNNNTIDSGAAYVFVRNGTTWSQQAYLKASNTGESDYFGISVAVSGDTVVVGAYWEDSNATGVNVDQTNNNAMDSGAAYVFVRSGTMWTQQAYLKASNTGETDQFGLSVAVSGDTVVVGAPYERSNATGVNGNQADNSTSSGAAYVFVRGGTTWTQQAYLKASNTGEDLFGYSVAVSGDTVVVGAVYEDSNATGVNGDGTNNLANDSGAAYIFVRSGTTWTQQAYLKASNTAAVDLFGFSVAVSGDTVVVGAYSEDSNATGVNGDGTNDSAPQSGAAYVFVRSGTTWSQQAYLKASNTAAGNQFFGYSVAVAGDTVVVGAIGESSNALVSGAAYVFNGVGVTAAPPRVVKSFPNGSTAVVGQAGVVRFEIFNDDAATNLSGISFTDTFPPGIVVADTSGSIPTGGTYTVTGNVLTVSGATVPANSSGTFMLNYTAGPASVTPYTNTINSVSSTQGGTNSTPSTAQLTVNKASTTVAITDDAPDPSVIGQSYAVTASVSVTSPGSGTPNGTITISDGTTSCMIMLPATSCNLPSNSVGAKTLTATYSGDANFNGSTSANASHTVNKADVTVTITSDNPDSSQVGQNVTVAFTVAAAAPGVGAPSGNVTITVSGGSETCTGTISAGSGSCTLALTSAGARTLTATYNADANFNTGTDTEPHTVVAPPSIAKAFSPPSTPINSTTTLTITITNPAANTIGLTGVGFTDNFPTGLVVATTPNVVNTCGGTITNPANGTLSAGNDGIKLSGGTVGTGAPRTCTVSVNVTLTQPGPLVNTINSVSSTEGGTNNTPAMATLQTNTPPTISSNNLSVKAGSSAASFTIATAVDPDQAVNTLGITINGNPTTASSNGVTVSNVAIQANGSVTAMIATTCAATTATFNLVVTDNENATGNGTLTVTVIANTPPVLSYSPTTVTAGTTPTILPAAGPSDNGTFTIGSVSVSPNNGGLGVLLNQSNGVVTILSALQIGTYTVTVPITDNCGLTHNAQLTVTVVCPTVSLSPASLPNATINTAYPQTISASPAGGNYSFSVTSGLLPAGLTLNSNGSFSGAPTQSGSFNFRVTATGFGSCSAFQDYTLVVNCSPITLAPTSLPGGNIGTTYNQTVSAAPAGTYNYAVSSGALPPGLSLNAATGAITGTPTTGGTFNFTVTASQGACSGSQSYTMTIGCAAITLSPASPLPNGQAGTAYTQTISASPAGSYTFSLISGSLPSGLTLNPTTGLLSGMPGTTGTFSFTVQALAGGGCTASQSYALAIVCPTVTLSPATLPNATTGTAYSQILSATPAGGNYTYAVTTGSLPTGLNLNSSTGVLSGTPTVTNSFTFRVTASGFGGCTGFRDYTIVVGGGACPTITFPATLPNGTIGGLYSNSAAASPAGSYSYAVTSGAVPPGTTLFTSFGLLFGYPTAAGTYTFTITATLGACTGSQTYTVLVSAGFASALSVGSDFDGDLKSDLSIFRADGNWEVSASRDGKTETTLWGAPYAPYNDLVVSGDYDGDGKTDPAVFRRGTEHAGYWFIKKSSDGELKHYFWGLPTDVPTPGDYDGDGKTDAAVWRASEGIWYIIRSSDNGIRAIHWGSEALGDVPVPGDYDGDGKTDAAVFRKSNGHWYVKRSSDDKTLDVHWGLGTDVPVPGDYDGDAKTDYAVWRASEGIWYWVESDSAALKTATLGAAGDVPVPTDYDGDGKADAAVWQAATGNWRIVRSSDGKTVGKIYGRSGDTPVPARRN